ncbi:hypothetical protein EV363DRAFT_1072765, partial [Boletus edulis]
MSHTRQNNSLYKSRLDYLDLCQEPNVHVEIKMAASFDFERLDGSLCILPAANPSITFSHGIDNALERASVQRINDIFVTEYLPALRKRLFSWSSVKLPSSMKERLRLDESISDSRCSAFHFPDPLVHSTPALLPRRELSVDDSLCTDHLSSVHSSFRVSSDFSNATFLDDHELDLSITSDRLEPSFIISSPQNVTIRNHR